MLGQERSSVRLKRKRNHVQSTGSTFPYILVLLTECSCSLLSRQFTVIHTARFHTQVGKHKVNFTHIMSAGLRQELLQRQLGAGAHGIRGRSATRNRLSGWGLRQRRQAHRPQLLRTGKNWDWGSTSRMARETRKSCFRRHHPLQQA